MHLLVIYSYPTDPEVAAGYAGVLHLSNTSNRKWDRLRRELAIEQRKEAALRGAQPPRKRGQRSHIGEAILDVTTGGWHSTNSHIQIVTQRIVTFILWPPFFLQATFDQAQL